MPDPTNPPTDLESEVDQQSLEEIAAQIRAANPSSDNVTATTEAIAPVHPVTPPLPAQSLTERVNTPVPTGGGGSSGSAGQVLAQKLAELEIIGSSQIDQVAAALTPAVLKSLNLAAPSEASTTRLTPTIPVTLIQANGQEQTLKVKTGDLFAFLTGQADAVTASK